MKNPTRTRASVRGFSLIELLVVIAIIASLAALSYGPIMKVVTDARIESGNKIANDLVFAVEQFEQSYDYLPYPSGSSASGDIYEYTGTELADLLKVLMAKEGADPDVNPKNQEFFTYQAAKNGVNGIVFDADGETPTGLKDPFGNDFTLVIDYSGDNKVNLSETVFNGHTNKDGTARIIRRVAVAGAQGPDKEFYSETSESGEDLTNDDVTSF